MPVMRWQGDKVGLEIILQHSYFNFDSFKVRCNSRVEIFVSSMW